MFITPANAVELQAKAVLARHNNRIAKKIEQDKPATPLPDFASQRLMRVRMQLVRLDKMMEEELDPQRIDRLASAQSRLAEQERILDGRPLPGSKRPRSDSARITMPGAWIEEAPAPAAVEVPPKALVVLDAAAAACASCVNSAQGTPPQVVVEPFFIGSQKLPESEVT